MQNLKPTHHIAFEAIGTAWAIDIYQSVADVAATQSAVDALIDNFDKTYSRFRTDSLVTTMSQQAGTYTLPANAEPLIKLYRKLYDLSGGEITPLIGQTLSDAGYDADYSLNPKSVVKPPEWDGIMSYNPPQLQLKQPALLDFGALGKGYLVDLVSQYLVSQKLTHFCVDGGGDMYAAHAPQQVGLEQPSDITKAIGIATIDNQALCASAGNRRAWADYNHIISPRTLRSPSHITAVWAVADTALLADAMTTALYFVEPDLLSKHYNFEYLLLHPDGSISASKHFPGNLFT